jgi:hypothetical protein
LFHDEKARKRLKINVWSRLHVIDPSIKPWKAGEKISDANPHVLHPDHFLQSKCFPAFWMNDWETNLEAGKVARMSFQAFCY